MKHIGILHSGIPHGSDNKVLPYSQQLGIARYNEMVRCMLVLIMAYASIDMVYK